MKIYLNYIKGFGLENFTYESILFIEHACIEHFSFWKVELGNEIVVDWLSCLLQRHRICLGLKDLWIVLLNLNFGWLHFNFDKCNWNCVIQRFSFLGGVVGVFLVTYFPLGEFRTADCDTADIVILLVKNGLGWVTKLALLPILIS
jgi:hypothetical protein